MLKEEEIVEIKRELERYPAPRGAVPEALRILQRTRGFISDETVKDVAAVVGVSPDDVDSIATFYSGIFRKPVGRHVIMLCDSVSCWVMGSEGLRAHLETKLGIRLGQTTPDGRFTLLPAACLGACDQAPALMVDDVLHENLTPERLDEILEGYL